MLNVKDRDLVPYYCLLNTRALLSKSYLLNWTRNTTNSVRNKMADIPGHIEGLVPTAYGANFLLRINHSWVDSQGGTGVHNRTRPGNDISSVFSILNSFMITIEIDFHRYATLQRFMTVVSSPHRGVYLIINTLWNIMTI